MTPLSPQEAPAAPGRGYMAPSAKSDWRTPQDVVDLLHVLWEGGPDLDPCAAPGAGLGLARHNFVLAEGRDGLALPWFGTCYVNPPFEDLGEWATKCRREHEERGVEVVLLLPSRTDTGYWHDQVASAAAICLWRGRMRFIGAASSAPFPTALAYWGPAPWAFHAVFRSRGMIVRPGRGK